ncbi:MAG: class I SAM-dependent methyltransferase [Bacillota bacterium]
MNQEVVRQIGQFRHRSIKELVDFVFTVGNGCIKPWQIKTEIQQLLEMVRGLRPKTIIEIGTATGGTLFLFCRIAEPDACIISVDLPGGRFGGGYDVSRAALYKAFALPKQRLHLIRASSHDQATFEQIRLIIGQSLVDFLFIDGDHTYAGVKSDFQMYSPLVTTSGIVALHDLISDTRETGCEVCVFWREIKRHYAWTELIHKPEWRRGGIGVLRCRPGDRWGVK